MTRVTGTITGTFAFDLDDDDWLERLEFCGFEIDLDTELDAEPITDVWRMLAASLVATACSQKSSMGYEATLDVIRDEALTVRFQKPDDST